MGWRDFTNATNERTVISAFFPQSSVGYTSPLIFSSKSYDLWSCLLGNLSSLVLDYVARQAIGGTQLTYGYLKQFAILPPSFYTSSRRSFVLSRVLELTYNSDAMSSFAFDLGYDGPPFRWDEERRALLRSELDCFYARSYVLFRNELRYVLDPNGRGLSQRNLSRAQEQGD